MLLNLIVSLVVGATISCGAFFLGRATDHAAAGRLVCVAVWVLFAVGLGFDLVTSERRARARGTRPRRTGHLVAMSIAALVAVAAWLITNNF